MSDATTPSAPPTSAADRLLAAAAEAIVEDGWGEATTRRIAERAGVNPGLVHYHFDSVEHLKHRAVIGALRAETEKILDPLQDQTPRQIITAAADWLTTMGPGDPMTVLVFEALPPAVRDPDLQGELAGLLTWLRDLLADRIRACHPSPAADPEIIAELMAAALDGIAMHLLAVPDLDVHAHFAPLLDLLGPERTPTDATTRSTP